MMKKGQTEKDLWNFEEFGQQSWEISPFIKIDATLWVWAFGRVYI